MLQIFSISLKTVAAVSPAYLQRTLPRRWSRAQGYLQRSDALRCLGAGLLLQTVLGCEERELCLSETAKPYLPGGKQFNLSHGGDDVVLAVDTQPVGIDIEPLSQSNLQIASTVFCEQELEWLKPQPLLRFHALWTMKESVMKATGLGLCMPPESFSVLPAEPELPHMYAAGQWYLRWTEFHGSVLAVCVAHPFEMPQIQQITDVPPIGG